MTERRSFTGTFAIQVSQKNVVKLVTKPATFAGAISATAESPKNIGLAMLKLAKLHKADIDAYSFYVRGYSQEKPKVKREDGREVVAPLPNKDIAELAKFLQDNEVSLESGRYNPKICVRPEGTEQYDKPRAARTRNETVIADSLMDFLKS